MILRKKVGVVLLCSASLAALGNYLWLLGFIPKPEASLMEARWVYALLVTLVALAMLCLPEDL